LSRRYGVDAIDPKEGVTTEMIDVESIGAQRAPRWPPRTLDLRHDAAYQVAILNIQARD